MLTQLNTSESNGSYASKITTFKNRHYFTALSSPNNRELYETDGTQNGTQRIAPPNSTASNPCRYTYEFFKYNDYLYFRANFNGSGYQLFRIQNTTVGIDEQFGTTFQVFPNPTKDILKITSEKDNHFTLYDLTGKALKTFDVNQSTEISMSDLNAGIYILRENGSGAQIKIVKE